MANLDGKAEDVIRAELNTNENSRLIAVSIAIFVVLFIYKDSVPVFLFGWAIGQLVIALPLLYKSSDAYEKTAYVDRPSGYRGQHTHRGRSRIADVGQFFPRDPGLISEFPHDGADKQGTEIIAEKDKHAQPPAEKLGFFSRLG